MENETQQQPSPSKGGLKLMTVFIVVLALHVLVIGGVSAYSLLKGTSDPVAQEEKKSESATEKPASVETPSVESTAPVMAENNNAANVATPEVSGTANVSPIESNVSQASAPIEPVVTTAAPVVPVIPASPVASAPVVKDHAVAKSSSTGNYTVSKGDTLSKIARTHGMKVAELKAINGLKSDNLKIGQALKVKESDSFATTSVSTFSSVASVSDTPTVASSVSTNQIKNEIASSVSTKSAVGVDYVVSKGDTLTKIAKQYNTTASAIMAANKIADATKLKIGMKLSIPTQSRQQAMEQTAPASTLQKSVAPSADFAMAK